jgi:hypothetical protein
VIGESGWFDDSNVESYGASGLLISGIAGSASMQWTRAAGMMRTPTVVAISGADLMVR